MVYPQLDVHKRSPSFKRDKPLNCSISNTTRYVQAQPHARQQQQQPLPQKNSIKPKKTHVYNTNRQKTKKGTCTHNDAHMNTPPHMYTHEHTHTHIKDILHLNLLTGRMNMFSLRFCVCAVCQFDFSLFITKLISLSGTKLGECSILTYHG